MRSEKTVRCMRDKLDEIHTMANPMEYRRYLMNTISTLNWVLGE